MKVIPQATSDIYVLIHIFRKMRFEKLNDTITWYSEDGDVAMTWSDKGVRNET